MKTITIIGIVSSYKNSIGHLQPIESYDNLDTLNDIKFMSNIRLHKGALYELSGNYNGNLLIVKEWKELHPNRYVNTADYLVSLGLDPHEAKKLAREFGISIWDALKNPSSICTKNIEVLKDAALSFNKRVVGAKVFKELKPFGFTDKEIFDILLETNCKLSVEERLKAIQNDIYSFTWRAKSDFLKIDRYALSYGDNDSVFFTQNRLTGAIYAALLLCDSSSLSIQSFDCSKYEDVEFARIEQLIKSISGSCCLKYDELTEIVGYLLCENIMDYQFEEALSKMFLKQLVFRTTINDEIYIYRKDLAVNEFYAAYLIKEKLHNNTSLADDFTIYRTIEDSEAFLDTKLSNEQVAAVKMAMNNTISVITGGPGTGKSATLKVLLETFMRLTNSRSIRLIAPTGQAAMRMSQATGFDSSTIHKALHLNPSNLEAEPKEISESIVLIDEASMIDATLLYKLLQSIKKDSKIVFIGDVDQLPSIGAGSVLQQFIAADSIPVSRLTRVFRQGDNSIIAQNSAKIKSGNIQLETSPDFVFIESSNKNTQRKICELYKKESEKYGEENVICLSPFRVHTSTGVNQLNDAIRKYVRNINDKTPSFKGIYLGDKVMFTKNAFGLVNGDVGFCTKIGKGEIECQFKKKKISLSKRNAISFLQPAYAQTVHQSQGLEYNTVIIVADTRHSKMNNKELVYTATSRAKNRCLICGQKEAFFDAIKKTPDIRTSNLATLIDEQ